LIGPDDELPSFVRPLLAQYGRARVAEVCERHLGYPLRWIVDLSEALALSRHMEES